MITFTAVNNSLQQRKLNEKLTKEKEETLCKQKYQRALAFQSKALLETSEELISKYASEALKEYIELLNEPHIVQAVAMQRKHHSSNAKEKTSTKILVEQRKVQKNTFLYLKYLVLKNMADVYKIVHHFEEAIECYWKALQIDDTDTSVWLNLGLLCFHKEDYPSARTAFERVLVFQPDHSVANEKIAETLFILGDFYECLQWSSQMKVSENSASLIAICKKELDYKTSSFFDLLDNQSEALHSQSQYLSDLYEKSKKFQNQISNQVTEGKKKVLLLKFERKKITWEYIGKTIIWLIEKHLKMNQNRLLSIEVIEDQVAEDMVIEIESLQQKEQTSGVKRVAENETLDKRRQVKRFRKSDNGPPVYGMFKLPFLLSKLLEKEKMTLINTDSQQESQQNNSSPSLNQNGSIEDISNDLCFVFLDTIMTSDMEFRIKDVTLLFIEILCSKLFSHKFTEGLLKQIRIIAKECIALKYLTFSSTATTALASLFVQKYFETDQYSNLIVARRLVHNLQGESLSSQIDISIEMQCRILWLLSIIEQKLNNPTVAVSLLEQCKSIVQRNQIHLPFFNTSFIPSIGIELIEQKIRSLNFNNEISNCVQLMKMGQLQKSLESLLRLKSSSLTDDFETEKLESLIIDCFYSLSDKSIEQFIQIFQSLSADIVKLKFTEIGQILFYFFSNAHFETHSKISIARLLHCLVLLCEPLLNIDEAEKEFVYLLYIFYWASKPHFSMKSQFILLKNLRIIYSMALQVPAELCNFEYLIEQFFSMLLQCDSIQLQNDILDELYILYHIAFGVKLTNPKNRVYDFTRLYQPFLKDTKSPELHTAKKELIEIAFLLMQPYAEEVLSTDAFERKNQLRSILSMLIKGVPLPQTIVQQTTQVKNLICKNYYTTRDATSTRNSICELKKNHSAKDPLYGKIYQYYGYSLFDVKEQFFEPNETQNFKEFLTDDFSNIISSLEVAVACYPGNFKSWYRLGQCYFYLSIALSDLQDDSQREQLALQIKCIEKQEQPNFVTILEKIRHNALECFFISNCIIENTTAMYYTVLALFDQIQFEKFKTNPNNELVFEWVRISLPLIKKCIESDPKKSIYHLLHGWLLEQDKDHAIDCLDCYEKAVQLKRTSATLFELNNALLALLRQNRQELIPLIQRYSRKVSVESFSHLANELYKSLISPMIQQTNDIWTDITLGFLECIQLDECYKSLFKLAECCCYGPWANWNAAQEIMSQIFKQRNIRDGKPIGFNYNMKYSSNKHLVTKSKNFRMWRYKSTLFYIEIVKQCKNLNLFSVICTGLRRSYLKEAPELLNAYRIALITYAETLWTVYHQTVKKEDLEKMKFLRYVNELCIYLHDKSVKGKVGLAEATSSVFELRSKLVGEESKNPSSSLEWKQFIQKTKDLFGLDFSAPAKGAATETENSTIVYDSSQESVKFSNIQESDIIRLVNSQKEEEAPADENEDENKDEDKDENKDENENRDIKLDAFESSQFDDIEEESETPVKTVTIAIENAEDGDEADRASLDLNITSQASQSVMIAFPLEFSEPQEEEEEEMEDDDMEESNTAEEQLVISESPEGAADEGIIDLDSVSDEEDEEDDVEDDVMLIRETRTSVVDLSSDESE